MGVRNWKRSFEFPPTHTRKEVSHHRKLRGEGPGPQQPQNPLLKSAELLVIRGSPPGWGRGPWPPSLVLLLWLLQELWVCPVAQSCPTLCNPIDCIPSGSSVHGILQTRTLKWVAIPFSRGSSQPRDQTQVSHIAGRFITVWATRNESVIPTGHPWWQGLGGEPNKRQSLLFSRAVVRSKSFQSKFSFPQWTHRLCGRLYLCSWWLFLEQGLQHLAFSFSVSSLSVTWTVVYKYTFIHSRNMHWVATTGQALCRMRRILFWRSMGPALRVVMGEAGTWEMLSWRH